MPFRKNIRKILSKLGGDKRDRSEKSAPSSTFRPLTADTVRPAGSNVFTAPTASAPRPVPQHIAAPVAVPQNYIPTSIDSSYHPGDAVGGGQSSSPTVPPPPTPLLDGYGEGLEPSPGRGQSFPSGGLLRPGQHDGERIISRRSTSGITSTTEASSDYDQHSTTHSLCASPVPTSACEVMSDINRGSAAGTTPPARAAAAAATASADGSLILPPRHTHSPVVTDFQGVTSQVTSTLAPGAPTSGSAVSHVTTNPSLAIVHTTVHPVVTEEQLQRVTREHHHHHIHPLIQPLVSRHILPTKYYLQTDPADPSVLREISAAEAKAYGEPVYTAEHVVAGDPVAEEVFGSVPTTHTRIATPHIQSTRTHASALAPARAFQTAQDSEQEVKRDAEQREVRALQREVSATGGSGVHASGAGGGARGSDSDSFTSSLSDEHNHNYNQQRENADYLGDLGDLKDSQRWLTATGTATGPGTETGTPTGREDATVVRTATFGGGGGGAGRAPPLRPADRADRADGRPDSVVVGGTGVLPDYL